MQDRGTRRSTRSLAEAEALRARIWELFLGNHQLGIPGKTQLEIAEILGCKQPNVSRHISICIKRFNASNTTKAGQYLSRELMVCAHRESEAHKRYETAERAWKKSIGIIQIVSRYGREAKDLAGKVLIDPETKKPYLTDREVSTREEKSVGDPRFLRAMEEADAAIHRWCDQRCKLLGLYAPKKIKLTDDDPISMSDAELKEGLAELLISGNGNGNGNGHGTIN